MILALNVSNDDDENMNEQNAVRASFIASIFSWFVVGVREIKISLPTFARVETADESRLTDRGGRESSARRWNLESISD